MASSRPQSLSTPALNAGQLQLDAFDDCARQSLAATSTRGSAEFDAASLNATSIWVSLVNGEQLHLRHLVPAASESMADNPDAFEQQALRGRSAFLLHGEVECGRVYSDGAGRGLAHYLLA
ncbi:MAG: hypothetical protein HKO07_09005, partial [Pseudomonadales bacterium]|nr:hypothetical protein [Pseudomonadales bacterium]